MEGQRGREEPQLQDSHAHTHKKKQTPKNSAGRGGLGTWLEKEEMMEDKIG